MKNLYQLFAIGILLFAHSANAQQSKFLATYNDPSQESYGDWGITHPLTGFPSDILRYRYNECIVGSTRDSDLTLVNFTLNGIPVWAKRFVFKETPFMAPMMARLSDSSIASVYEFLDDNENSCVGLLKVDKNGNLIYSRKVRTTTRFTAQSIAATDDGGFMMIAVGCYGANLLFRFDAQGQMLNCWSLDNEISHISAFAIFSDDGINFKVFAGASDKGEVYDVTKDGVASGGKLFRLADTTLLFGGPGMTRSITYPELYYSVKKVNDGKSIIILGYNGSTNSLLWVKQVGFADSLMNSLGMPRIFPMPGGDIMLAVSDLIQVAPYRTRTILMKLDKSGQVKSCNWSGSTIADSMHNETFSGGLYVPEDSTLMLAVWNDSSLGLGRMSYDLSGLCETRSFYYTIHDLPIASQSGTGYSASGSLLQMADVPTTQYDLSPGTTFYCVDTVSMPDPPVITPTSLKRLAGTPWVFNVYPIPAVTQIFVSSPGAGKVNFDIYNAVGSVVKSDVYDAGIIPHSIYIGDLPAGMYIYRAKGTAGTYQSGKLHILK